MKLSVSGSSGIIVEVCQLLITKGINASWDTVCTNIGGAKTEYGILTVPASTTALSPEAFAEQLRVVPGMQRVDILRN